MGTVRHCCDSGAVGDQAAAGCERVFAVPAWAKQERTAIAGYCSWPVCAPSVGVFCLAFPTGSYNAK